MTKSLTSIFQKVTDFSKEHPKIFAFLTKGAALLAGLTAGVVALGAAFWGVRAAIKQIEIAFKGVDLISKLSPVRLAIAGIVVGAVLVIKHWTQVKEFFVNLWEWLTEKFAAVENFFGNIGNKVGGFFKKLWPFGKSSDNEKVTAPSEVANKNISTELKLPTNKSIANSNNKTLTNNMTFNISGTADTKSVADEIAKAVKQTSLDAMYDSFYVG
jgi:hypothetical protein